MQKVRFPIAAVVVAFLFTTAANAQDTGPWNSTVWIDVFTTDAATAGLTIDPAAPVVDVVVESDTCGIERLVEVEPGYWEGVGPPESAWECWFATFTISLAETGTGDADPCPFIGLDRVTLMGDTSTDSYDPGAGLYAPESAGDAGHLCSNGNIRLLGNVAVNGDAHPGPDHGVRAHGEVTVTGSTASLLEPIVPDPIDPGDAMTVNDNHLIPRTDRGRSALKRRGKFRLRRNDSVSLPPGTYFFRSIELARGSTLHITGETVIYVARSVDARRGGIVAEPGDLDLMVMGRNVVLSGETDLHADVYAPRASIQRWGTSHVFGSLLGRKLHMMGWGGLHAEASSGTDVGSSFTLEWEYSD